MDDFYVVLPSNVINRAGIPNKTSHYVTHLPTSLTLDRRTWRVAVVQADFLATWTNMSGPLCHVRVKEFHGDGRPPTIAKFDLKSGNIQNVRVLVKDFNAKMQAMRLRSRLSVNGDGRCTMRLWTLERVILHDSFAKMLGFEQSRFDGAKESKEGGEVDHLADAGGDAVMGAVFEALGQRGRFVEISARSVADLNAKHYNIYLYCNLVENSFVGDHLVPLLQTIPIDPVRVNGGIIHREYSSPHYVSLATNDVSVIEMQLCDDAGDLIRFERGHVVIKLHFKKFA